MLHKNLISCLFATTLALPACQQNNPEVGTTSVASLAPKRLVSQDAFALNICKQVLASSVRRAGCNYTFSFRPAQLQGAAVVCALGINTTPATSTTQVAKLTGLPDGGYVAFYGADAADHLPVSAALFTHAGQVRKQLTFTDGNFAYGLSGTGGDAPLDVACALYLAASKLQLQDGHTLPLAY